MTRSKITRRSFLQTAAAGAALAAPGIANAKPQKRPNLLVIVSDQQHGEALGFKDPFFSTPHLDRPIGRCRRRRQRSPRQAWRAS